MVVGLIGVGGSLGEVVAAVEGINLEELPLAVVSDLNDGTTGSLSLKKLETSFMLQGVQTSRRGREWSRKGPGKPPRNEQG